MIAEIESKESVKTEETAEIDKINDGAVTRG